MDEPLKQSDRDELSAYLDGELSAEQAEQVRRRAEVEPAWREALERLHAVDALLDAWQPPAAPPELAERIVRLAGRPRRRVLTWRRVLAGAAAAAAVVALAIGLGRQTLRPVPQREELAGQIESPEAPMDREELDEFAVENLGFFKDYDVLTDFETLEAIERVERSRSSGT
jgi:anti-sigma factor RsiW